ncbi:MAG TPA: TonB family protein [Gemmatimonadaceae bacterium]|nr:TonB family protein [Gemmatimonadaceae bacterium]
MNSVTDETGKFRLAGVPNGDALIHARRVGFVPIERSIQINSPQSIDNIELRMAAAPRTLSSVIINAARPEYKGRLAGYYQRLERRSSGHFIGRDEIDKKSFRTLSQLLRGVPGINSVSLRTGGNGIRMRGRGCRPLVWIDGVPMPAGEVDLDAFPPNSLHGIELYLGATAIPFELQGTGSTSNCGTIALWSRGSDTEAPKRNAEGKTDLTRLLESMTVFSADQVERAAVVQDAEGLKVEYPPELFAKGVAGSVLAEFVVDTAGVIEEGTVAVVSSTDPLFSSAVLKSLANVHYVPAMKAGHAVRQVVHQPYRFVPGSRHASQ